MTNYNKGLIKIFSLSIVIFLLVIALAFYLKLQTSSASFVNHIQKNKLSLLSDFKKLHFNYIRQIKFIKSYIEELKEKLSEEELKIFFNSSMTLILDRSNINTIIITDKNFNIKFLDNSLAQENLTFKNKKRNYLEKIRNNPDQIVLGEIVEGVLSHNISIPLAIGIKNPQGGFGGSIIFSINLESLNRDLIRGSLCNLIISDNKLSKTIKLEIIQNHSKTFFLKNVLLTTDACMPFVEFDEFSKKYLHLEYNIQKYRQKFFQELISIIILITALFITVLLLLYFYIFRPIKSVSPMLEVALHPNNITDGNFFHKLAKFIINQSYQLQEQNFLYKQQETRLASVLYLSAFIAKYINNRSENLTEDVEDVIASFENKAQINFQHALREIYQISLNNEQNIKSILNASIEVLDLTKNQHKEPVDIKKFIKELNLGVIITILVSNSSENSDYVTNVISGPVNHEHMLYKVLFDKLIQEILLFEDGITKLSEIKIDRNKAISFIFDFVNKKFETKEKNNLINAKIWGALNNIQIKVYYIEQKMVIIAEFCE